MSKRIVIIGGDAAGMSAAAKIKRELPDAEVVVFEQGKDISYSACGMPYWIGGIIEDERKLTVMTPQVARKRRGIDVQIRHRVNQIHPAKQIVTVQNLEENTEFETGYDFLVIATGASAHYPPIEGLTGSGIFSLRSLQDGRKVYEYMNSRTIAHATIIGGGYIGLEMAEALRERNIPTTVIETLPQLLPNFDTDMVENVTAHLAEHGVEVRLQHQVKRVEHTDERLLLHLNNRAESSPSTLATDLIIVSTGVRPNVELAESAGLRLGSTGAIWVDREMRTSNPAIYAAGDCVEHYNIVTGENSWVPLATSANKGGRLAGDNIVNRICGRPAEGFPGIAGTAVVKVFDYTLSATGLTERAAKESRHFGPQGEFVGSTRIENYEKTGYWPGVEEIEVKLVFDKRDGRILGGQLAGKAGINKRIDIIATAISARMTLAQVAMLDLSYAPPYSPTYDPIQICANVGQRQVDPSLRFRSGSE